MDNDCINAVVFLNVSKVHVYLFTPTSIADLHDSRVIIEQLY